MSPYFDESISTFSKYALDLFGYGMGLSSSSGSEYSSFGGYKRPLESYQSMIRQFPLQIVRSSPSSSNFLLVSLLDDTHYLSIDVRDLTSLFIGTQSRLLRACQFLYFYEQKVFWIPRV